MKKLFFVSAVVLAACSDPPPPSLARIAIDDTTNDGTAGLTYVRNDVERLEADPTKGVVLGDGLSYVLTLSRRIADPPDKKADSEALLEKPFTMTTTGDVVTAARTTQSSRVIIHTVKPGAGTVVFTVEGATGSVTMPVTVVEQSAVPSDVYPPDAPRPTPEAGADDAGADDGGT
ncbi:MAG: hypothetical protein KIT84_26535 [Labilithrix sp.]|nr:hypothetical protein [Labilithrix sp.]MCW5814611.1 hypothetical protein [Labilithrix sp.]